MLVNLLDENNVKWDNIVYEKAGHKKWAGGCCFRHGHECSFENEFVKFLTSS